MEFMLNTHDWPQTNKWHKEALPVFSFSKVVSMKKEIIILNIEL